MKSTEGAFVASVLLAADASVVFGRRLSQNFTADVMRYPFKIHLCYYKFTYIHLFL